MKRNEKGQFIKGHNTWNKGKKGVMPTPWNKGKKGLKRPEEIKRKISETMRKKKINVGSANPMWKNAKCAKLCKYCGETFVSYKNLNRIYCSEKCQSLGRVGYHPSRETREKISAAHKGKKLSKEHIQALKNSWKDRVSWNYKGTTSLYKRIRRMSMTYEWGKTIFERDYWECQDCGKHGGLLHAHHLKPFAQILNEFLAHYDNFSPIEDKETLVRLSYKWKDFWDIDNGVTLCEDCHIKRHKQNAVFDV